jgi:hypothetical protein
MSSGDHDRKIAQKDSENSTDVSQNNQASEIGQKAEVVLYRSGDENIPVEVTYFDETFWLTQKSMAELFHVTSQTIARHLQDIYNSGELEENRTIKKNFIVQNEGSRRVRRQITFYNLDAIIAVGYRVNSMQATHFRQWATKTLREYIIKGFVLNDDMLKNGRPFGKDYFDELLQRIRDIRASERRFWQKITDVFQAVSSDYDPSSKTAHNFYANIQNKLHFAITGHTAAEIINERADAHKPHMGLTNWKSGPEGRIYSYDATVAKNYLTHEEIDRLNTLTTGLLDAVEARAQSHTLTTMSECVTLVDQYIELTGGQVLVGKGHIRHQQALSKAQKEFQEFNKTQDNDFEKFARRVERGE